MGAEKLRVLSIDGGGVRGYLPALVLAEIERRAGRPIRELFDLIVGTSTGGIIGIAASAGVSAAALAEFYPHYGRRIFGGVDGRSAQESSIMGSGATLAESLDRASRSFGALFGGNPRDGGNARHRPDGLESVLLEVLGETRLSQVGTPLAVTTYDNRDAVPVVLASRDAVANPLYDLPLRVVARATSAAPTFFPPATVQWAGTEHQFVDGGVWANNPAAVALSEALAILGGTGQGADSITMLSLGTGAAPGVSVLDQNSSWVGVAKDLAGMATSVWAGELLARRALDEGRFHRFQVVDARIAGAMNDPSVERLAALRAAAETVIAKQSDALDAAIEQLVPL